MATSPGVARRAVEAARQAGATEHPHAATWQPWEPVGTDASIRFRTEIAAALAHLDGAQKNAGQILDQAYASAAGIAGPLREAAWASWRKYMAAADDATSVIMTPALEAYDQAIANAKAAYDRALNDAQDNYRAMLQSARAGKDAAGGIAAKV